VHAPRVRYLSYELDAVAMVNDYNAKHPTKPVGYSSYRRVLREMKISFAKLGLEECSTCQALEGEELHQHKLEANLRRAHYRADGEANDKLVYTLDLQKIMLLPRLEQFKEAIFCRRLVTFHETLAPAGQISEEKPVLSAIWHEGIAGRSAREVASAILKLLQSPQLPEKEEMVVWLDNCSGQNKNYVLFQTLYAAVKQQEIGYKTLTLKYFIPGHSFMAADSFHASVERQLKKTKAVINIKDFERCVRKSGSDVVTLMLRDRDFLQLPDSHSQRKAGESRIKVIVFGFK